MKYTDINFNSIRRYNNAVERYKELARVNHPALKTCYLFIDGEMVKCLMEYRTLHSNLRQMDFTELREQDFGDTAYICNRLNRMDKGFKLLMSMYKG